MAIDWSQLYKKYKGLWITLEENEKTVISTGRNAKEAWTKAQKKGFNKPILTHMTPHLTSYVGHGL